MTNIFHASITGVYETAQVRIILGDVPVNYVGYPLGERNGNIVRISIVLEEMAYYFEGNRDIDSVIEIIQSRASIFVSENH